jgi:hypothetical protein
MGRQWSRRNQEDNLSTFPAAGFSFSGDPDNQLMQSIVKLTIKLRGWRANGEASPLQRMLGRIFNHSTEF